MATFRNRPTSTENYRNPTHQEYVTGDGWKSGESDTDAPGAKKAKAAGEEGKAGLKAETARPQASADMTGNQSMPEQKTKLGVTCVTIKPNGGQMDQIKGGDPLSYLGHFRSPKVLKEGHNQGPPFPTSGAGQLQPHGKRRKRKMLLVGSRPVRREAKPLVERKRGLKARLGM